VLEPSSFTSVGPPEAALPVLFAGALPPPHAAANATSTIATP
jgi:hypothetical protein